MCPCIFVGRYRDVPGLNPGPRCTSYTERYRPWRFGPVYTCSARVDIQHGEGFLWQCGGLQREDSTIQIDRLTAWTKVVAAGDATYREYFSAYCTALHVSEAQGIPRTATASIRAATKKERWKRRKKVETDFKNIADKHIVAIVDFVVSSNTTIMLCVHVSL